MIAWTATRKNKACAVGTKTIGEVEVTWTIKKSVGGMNYQLFMGESSQPLYTRPTINDCKILAEAFL